MIATIPTCGGLGDMTMDGRAGLGRATTHGVGCICTKLLQQMHVGYGGGRGKGHLECGELRLSGSMILKKPLLLFMLG